MDLGSMMGDLITNAGHSQIAGAQQQQRQAQADDTRAQAQMRQMSALSMQQDVADRKAITDETKASSEEFQRSSKTSADVQKLASAKEASAISHNQFGMAKEYAEMSKMAEAEQQTALKNKAEEAHQKNEGTAQAAAAYEAIPSMENAKALAARAAAAGEQNIPVVGSPEFASWAVAKKTAAMDSSKRLEWVQKEADVKANQDRLKQKQEEDNAAKLQAERDKAAYQNGQNENRQLQLQILREGQRSRAAEAQARREDRQAKTESAKQASGDKLTSAERTMVTGVVGAVGEATRGIRNVLSMPVSTVSGAFQALHSNDVIGSLTKVGGNAVTPESTQMYTATTRGLGMEIGRALTLGGGRGVTQAQIDEFESMVQAQPGDTEFTAMYKLSNAADILKNRLETLPDSPIKKVREEQDKYMEELKKIPSPMEIWAAAQKNPKSREQIAKVEAPMGKALANVRGAMQDQDTSVGKEAAKSSVPVESRVINGTTYHKNANGKWEQ